MLADVADLGIFRNMYELSLVVESPVTSYLRCYKMAERLRDDRGRFESKSSKKKAPPKKRRKIHDHDYYGRHICDGKDSQQCSDTDCPLTNNISGKHVDRNWKEGRRVVDFFVLLSALQSCKFCRLGPVPLTIFNILGELKKGLSGYLYVKCMNPDCGKINLAPYGKTHRQKKRGMPCFAVNTKLGTCKYMFKFFISLL